MYDKLVYMIGRETLIIVFAYSFGTGNNIRSNSFSGCGRSMGWN